MKKHLHKIISLSLLALISLGLSIQPLTTSAQSAGQVAGSLGLTAVSMLSNELREGTGSERTASQVINRIGGKVAESTICGADWDFGVLSISGAEFCDMAGLFNRVPTGSLSEGIGTLEDDLSGEITQHTSIRRYILDWTNFFLTFLGLIAVLFVVYAGFLYVTSSGNTEQTDKAKKIITYTVIGIIIILGSYALVNTLINFNEGDTISSGTSTGSSSYSSTTGTSTTTVSTSQNLNGTENINGLQELDGLMETLGPLYTNRFELYVELKEDVIPALNANQEVFTQNADLISTSNLQSIVNQLNALTLTLDSTTLGDLMYNDSLTETIETAKDIQELYLNFENYSTPNLNDFIIHAETILYGSSTSSQTLTGRTGSPTAHLSLSTGSSTTLNGQPAYIVNLNGKNSTPSTGYTTSNITIDFDTSTTTDENKSVNTSLDALFSYTYPVRTEPYTTKLKITDSSGSTDTVTRTFTVTENGIQATDSGDETGNTAFARLSVTADTSSSNSLTVIFDPTNSIASSNSTLTSFYIDTNLSQDSDGNGDPADDTDKTGTTLTTQKHTYNKAGTYAVKLVIKDSNGNQDSIVQEITLDTDSTVKYTANQDSVTTTQTTNTITGLELLDYVYYGYNLNDYDLDLGSIREALELWYENSLPHTTSINSTYTEMLFRLDQMIANEDYTSTLTVESFANSVTRLLEKIAAVPAIVAQVTATPSSSGKAPYTVELSAVNSYAPTESGATIDPLGYCWSGIATNPDKGITRSKEQALYGPVQNLTFIQPGSYLVKLDIPTNGMCNGIDMGIESTQNELLSGSTAINITVLPPSTNINVNITPPCRSDYNTSATETSTDTETEQSTGYNADSIGTLRNGQACYMSLTDAVNGVTFDPSSSTAAAGRNLTSLEWKIGNDKFGPYASPTGAKVTYSEFNYPSTYYVNLTTTDSTGEQDKFNAEIHIMEVIADMLITPTSGSVDTTFSFSAQNSQTDNATITSYSWNIINTSDDTETITSTEKNFTHTFDSAGTYTVTLAITDTQGRTATTNQTIEVISEDPVANFSTKQNDNTRPATYIFDAQKSYDPDSRGPIYCYWYVDGHEIEITGGDGQCSNPENILDEYNPSAESRPDGDDIVQHGVGLFEYTFATTGTHTITLEVEGDNGGIDTLSRNITVNSTLALDFDPFVDDELSYSVPLGQAVTFSADSPNANSFDWSFGDNNRDSTTSPDITHTYTKSGTYTVQLKAYSNEGDTNTITKQITVAKRNTILASYSTYKDGQVVDQLTEKCNLNTLEVTRQDTLRFDASSSLNRDGSHANLKYSWDFDDGYYAEGSQTTHRFDELTGNKCFNITLTVQDKNDPSIYSTSNSAYIRVVNATPTLSGLRVSAQGNANITPLTINLSLSGASDPDGSIASYKWWYFLEGNSTRHDVHETSSPNTQMTLSPIGQEGNRLTYHFVVELTDNEGATITSTEELGSDPILNLVTGYNTPPTASFTVDKTTVKTGEEVRFRAEMKDSEGNILPTEAFLWDFDGDGRYDDTSTGAFATHAYDTGGTYNARLKITNNGLSDTYEMPIYIEAETAAPKAAFTYKSTGTTVTFINNSEIDPNVDLETVTYRWDFDATTDTDGDTYITNDTDSTSTNPIHTYSQTGTYQVILEVRDGTGQSNRITRPIEITTGTSGDSVSTSNSSTTALYQSANLTAAKVLAVLDTLPTPNILDGKIYLEGTNQNLTFDFSNSKGSIAEYRVDKNIYFDTDGDGDPANDVDNRTHTSFTQGGTWTTNYDASWEPITAQLTITTIYGETSTDQVAIKFATAPEVSSEELTPTTYTNQPKVTFAITPDITVARTEITFDATQTDQEFTRYIWDFDADGQVDTDTTEALTTHTFDSTGNYLVTLLAVTKDDEVAEYTAIVEIISPVSAPTANFTTTLDGLTANFHNQSTVDPALTFHQPTYEWQIYTTPTETETETAEEYILDSNISPNHTFTETGTYQVTLTMTDYYGQIDTLTKEIVISTETPETPAEINTDTTKPTTSEITTDTESSSSVLSIITKIILWIIIIIVLIATIGTLIAFLIFRKKYPNHSFTDFLEYVQLTLAGEEYGPAAPTPLATDTTLLSTPPTPQPPTPTKQTQTTPESTKPASTPKPTTTPAPTTPTNQNKPEWLKKASQNNTTNPQAKPEIKPSSNPSPASYTTSTPKPKTLQTPKNQNVPKSTT